MSPFKLHHSQIRICFLFFLAFLCNKNSAQIIDSIHAQYDTSSSKLEVRVLGSVIWSDHNAITKISDTVDQDTVEITVFFLPCQSLQTFLPYDTTVIVNHNVGHGMKWIRVLAYHQGYPDSNSCYYNPNPGIRDAAYTTINIPLWLDSYPKRSWQLFPNPVRTILHYQVPNGGEPRRISILNVSGKRVLENNSPGNNSIRVSNLPTGVYFLQLEMDFGVITRQFVKN